MPQQDELLGLCCLPVPPSGVRVDRNGCESFVCEPVLYLGFSFHSLALAVHAGAENETMITLNATEGQDLKRAFDELPTLSSDDF